MTKKNQTILSKLRGKLMIGVVLGAAVYLALVVFSDWEKVKSAFIAFPWKWFPVIIALTFANYMFRFLKWHFYLGRLDIHIRKKDSLIIFLSGLVGTITPGKIGELLKALLLRETDGTPMSKSAPIVIAERMTDFVALVIISLAGVALFALGSNIVVLLLVVGFLGAFVGVVSHRGLSLWGIGLFEKMPVVGKFAEKFHVMYESTYLLFRLTPLSVATFWSLLAWACECLGFWIVLHVLSVDAPLLTAAFIYAFGTIVGVVSPGGLGVMDGSMVGMLTSTAFMNSQQMSAGSATAATMIIRIATLWFAVFVGVVTLAIFQKRFSGAAGAIGVPQSDDTEQA